MTRQGVLGLGPPGISQPHWIGLGIGLVPARVMASTLRLTLEQAGYVLIIGCGQRLPQAMSLPMSQAMSRTMSVGANVLRQSPRIRIKFFLRSRLGGYQLPRVTLDMNCLPKTKLATNSYPQEQQETCPPPHFLFPVMWGNTCPTRPARSCCASSCQASHRPRSDWARPEPRSHLLVPQSH